MGGCVLVSVVGCGDSVSVAAGVVASVVAGSVVGSAVGVSVMGGSVG